MAATSVGPTLYRGAVAPVTGRLGDIWIDIASAPVVNLCTAESPLTWTPLSTGGGRLSWKTVADTTYTPILADENVVLKFTNSSAVTVTVPQNVNVAFEIGSAIHFAQWGTGQVTVQGDTGVTIRNASTLKTRVQYSMLSLLKADTNEWVWFGDMF